MRTGATPKVDGTQSPTDLQLVLVRCDACRRNRADIPPPVTAVVVRDRASWALHRRRRKRPGEGPGLTWAVPSVRLERTAGAAELRCPAGHRPRVSVRALRRATDAPLADRALPWTVYF